MAATELGVHKTDLAGILPLRAQFLHEARFQVRYDACHARGWTDSYLLTVGGVEVGYGSVKGREIADRDTAFEFYVLPPFRAQARALFRELIAVSGVTHLEAQTNDAAMSAMLFEFAHRISADVMLFEAHVTARLTLPGGRFRRRRSDEPAFTHTIVPVGDYVVELDGEVAGSGGFLLHYNEPFADIYMEVAEPFRRRGVGSFLVQEVIRECHLAGRVPAARTGITNLASRATLVRAGLRPCGFMLLGEVDPARAGLSLSTPSGPA